MKFLINFFVLFFFGYGYSQEPPAFFKIDITVLVGIHNDIEKFYDQYEIGALDLNDKYLINRINLFTSNVSVNSFKQKIIGKDHWEINIKNDLFIPISYFIDSNHIFSLHIKEKTSSI